MSDVWDLTDKDRGDHVLIALTIDECKAISTMDEDPRRPPCYEDQRDAWNSAVQEIERCLRDQKGIEP